MSEEGNSGTGSNAERGKNDIHRRARRHSIVSDDLQDNKNSQQQQENNNDKTLADNETKSDTS